MSFQTYLLDTQIIEGVMHSLGRTINTFNARAYHSAVDDYKKRVNSGEKISHGVLVHHLATTYNIDPRALDEMLTRMIKAQHTKKAQNVNNNSDPETPRD